MAIVGPVCQSNHVFMVLRFMLCHYTKCKKIIREKPDISPSKFNFGISETKPEAHFN